MRATVSRGNAWSFSYSEEVVDEAIWCEVRLDDVADVLDAYDLWKDGPWYHSIEWRVVSEAFAELLQRKAVDGVVVNLLSEIEEVADGLCDLDQQGLIALVNEPITVTPIQLTNGGHRLAAMRGQGVAVIPGLFHRDDLGHGVLPERIYPVVAGRP